MDPSGEMPLGNNEINKDTIQISAIDFSSVQEAQAKEVSNFVISEREKASAFLVGKDPNEPDVKQRLEAQMSHAIYGLKSLNKREDKQGYLITAHEDSNLTGFGIVNVDLHKDDPNKINLYFGRAWESQGKGIATRILSKQIDIVRSLGVNQYLARVSPESKKVYERLRIPFNVMEEREDGTFKLLVDLSNQ